jgi:hypothetical protein
MRKSQSLLCYHQKELKCTSLNPKRRADFYFALIATTGIAHQRSSLVQQRFKVEHENSLLVLIGVEGRKYSNMAYLQ